MKPFSDRRTFIKATVAGVAGLSLPGSLFSQAAPQNAGPQRLADDLFVISLPGEANVLAHIDSKGVMLVDGGSAKGSDAILKAVSGLPGVVGTGTVHTLFNTHWHPEQTGSNERLGKAGATIIAHENTRLWMGQNVRWPWNGQKFAKLPKVAQPNKTFYTTAKLDSDIRYGYISDAAHTDGDMYVYFPKQNVLAVGGAVAAQAWPVVDWWTGGWIGGMVGGIQRVLTVTNADTRIVPANGPVLSVTEVRALVDMYGKIYDSLSGMMNKGRGPTEAVAAEPGKEFEAKMGPSDEFVRRSFESLWAYLSPDA